MTWPSQVVHVAAKDLRQHRLVLGAYGALVLWLVVRANMGRDGASETLNMAQLLGPFGTLIAGMLIQSDSPTRPNALWRVHPLSPGAVYVAKLAMISLFTIGFPSLVSKMLSTIDFGMPIGGPGVNYQVANGIASTGITIAVAAATNDLIGFILASVAMTVLAGVRLAFMASGGGLAALDAFSVVGMALQAAAVCLPYLVVSHAYRGRPGMHARLAIGASVIAACALGGPAFAMGYWGR